jgi:hypothetical protein
MGVNDMPFHTSSFGLMWDVIRIGGTMVVCEFKLMGWGSIPNSPYEITPWDFKIGTWDNHRLVLIQVVVYSLGATWVVSGGTWCHPHNTLWGNIEIAKRSHYLYISRNI